MAKICVVNSLKDVQLVLVPNTNLETSREYTDSKSDHRFCRAEKKKLDRIEGRAERSLCLANGINFFKGSFPLHIEYVG